MLKMIDLTPGSVSSQSQQSDEYSLPSIPLPPPLPVPSSLPLDQQAAIEDGIRPNPVSQKLGRRSRFSNEEDLVNIREVSAAKAHISPNGETRERFEISTSKANASKTLKNTVTWKAVQDRYKSLQERFDHYDRVKGNMSEVGGDVGEMEELLSAMGEARSDFDTKRNEKRQKVIYEKERKDLLGAEIRKRETQRVIRRGEDDTAIAVEDGDADVQEDVPRSARGSAREKRKVQSFTSIKKKIAAFTAVLKNGDEKKNELEAQRFDLDCERFEAENMDRILAREERLKATEAAQKLELEKFRIMMDVFRQVQGPGESGGSAFVGPSAATGHNSQGPVDSGASSGDADVQERVPRSAPGSVWKKRKVQSFTAIKNEIAAFTVALKNRDEKRIEIEAQRFALDRERFEAEKMERILAREERLKEAEAAQKLELEKFRIIMDVFRQVQGPGESGGSADVGPSLETGYNLQGPGENGGSPGVGPPTATECN